MAHYIDKDAVVAEINRVLNSYDPNEITSGRYALVNLLAFLNTLKVKEVDLEKETEMQERKDIENAFKAGYELGMAERNKVHKGEYSNEQTRT